MFLLVWGSCYSTYVLTLRWSAGQESAWCIFRIIPFPSHLLVLMPWTGPLGPGQHHHNFLLIFSSFTSLKHTAYCLGWGLGILAPFCACLYLEWALLLYQWSWLTQKLNCLFSRLAFWVALLSLFFSSSQIASCRDYANEYIHPAHTGYAVRTQGSKVTLCST